jgi:restriction system protein
VRRRGPALEVLFSAFAWNGIRKMNPTCAHGSELGATVHCGEIKIQRDFSVGRRDQGIIEDVIEIAAAMPLVGFALAIILAGGAAYFQWVNPKIMMGFGRVFALFFWALAVICALASLFGFVRQKLNIHRRSRRLDSQRSIEDLRQLSPSDFEQTIADLFRRQGYRVDEIGGVGDGGVDLILRRNGDGSIAHLVQCKRYTSWKVGVAEVREFFGAMAAYQSRCEGVFVTCGRYTAEARTFAAGKPIRLIDGDELLSMLGAINPLAPAVESFTAPQPSSDTPLCPRCRVAMQRRTAQRGPHAGKPFWGCPNYPGCRQIFDIEKTSA